MPGNACGAASVPNDSLIRPLTMVGRKLEKQFRAELEAATAPYADAAPPVQKVVEDHLPNEACLAGLFEGLTYGPFLREAPWGTITEERQAILQNFEAWEPKQPLIPVLHEMVTRVKEAAERAKSSQEEAAKMAREQREREARKQEEARREAAKAEAAKQKANEAALRKVAELVQQHTEVGSPAKAMEMPAVCLRAPPHSACRG